jgi:O-antigen/teichoic acid export membrane protein
VSRWVKSFRASADAVTNGGRATPPHALDAVPRSPAIDAGPPVSPNLARAPEIHQIRANFLQTLLFKGISTPLALVLVILQSRYLHTSGRGSFVLVVLSVSILARLLGQLGYAVANRMQAHPRVLHELVHRAFAIGAVLGALGTGAIVAWGMVTPGVGLTIAAIAAGALVPTIIWQCVCGVLLGLGRVRVWNVIQTLPPALTGFLMLLIVAGLHGGVRGAVLAWTLAHLLTALSALAATRDVWQPLPVKHLLNLFNLPLAELALTMGAVQVVNLISYRIELFVLDRDRGIGQVGVYSIAVQTGEMLWLVAGAIATAVTAPCLHDDEEQAASLIARSGLKALTYTAIIAVAVGVVAPFLFSPLLGHAFSGASQPLRLLLPGIVVYAPVTILVVYLSVRHGKPRLSLAVSAVGMIVTLIAALILIPSHGASGAALASTIGYLAGATLAWVFLRRLARTARAAPATNP